VRIRNLRNKVIQFHVMHDKLPQINPRNQALFDRTKKEHVVRAAVGLAETRSQNFVSRCYGAASTSVATTK